MDLFELNNRDFLITVDYYSNYFEVGFEHNTSSLNYPQSNGKVENAVKTAKNLMKKAMDSQSDPYLALLAWRNTPSESVNSSPAQRIFGRRTKIRIPTSVQLLKPQLYVDVEQKLRKNKAKQSFYYDRGSKELNDLQPGDVIRIQPPRGIGRRKPWTKARVGEKMDVRLYDVRTERRPSTSPK